MLPVASLPHLCAQLALPSPASLTSLQVFEFQPDPGLQTIAFERPDLVEAVAELGERELELQATVVHS